jgi:hypothetical protein
MLPGRADANCAEEEYPLAQAVGDGGGQGNGGLDVSGLFVGHGYGLLVRVNLHRNTQTIGQSLTVRFQAPEQNTLLGLPGVGHLLLAAIPSDSPSPFYRQQPPRPLRQLPLIPRQCH